MNALVYGFGLTLLLAACGSDSTNTSTGANSGGSDSGSGAAGGGATGGGATGSGATGSGASGGGTTGSTGTAGSGGAGTCDPGQVHVFPCCGGPPPLCEPLPASGECPPGTHAADCPNGPGCEMDPCVAPPPYCADEADVKCEGTSCSTASGDCSGYMENGELYCACA